MLIWGTYASGTECRQWIIEYKYIIDEVSTTFQEPKNANRERQYNQKKLFLLAKRKMSLYYMIYANHVYVFGRTKRREVNKSYAC